MTTQKFKDILDARVKFAQHYIKTKEGKPWNLDGRAWVIDEYWKPFEGWKLWPKGKRLCSACSEKANTFADYDAEVEGGYTQCVEHDVANCDGLFLSPIVCTVLNLGRRDGKTFNTAAYSLATIFQSRNESITFVAASEAQTYTLFEENYRKIILGNLQLADACAITAQTIKVYKTKSIFECVSTAHGSITGRGRTKIILDEARDVPARTAMALIPSVFDHSGWHCPHGHVRFEGMGIRSKVGNVCSVCSVKLIPWYGRIAIMSSSGLITGTDRDWFAELVEELEKNPHPNYHCFRSDRDDLNPDKSKTIINAVEQVFSKLDATRAYVDIEIHNQSRLKDDAFLTRVEIEACIDPQLENVITSERKSVAFLDTSMSVDKTSLVILADRTEDEDYINIHAQQGNNGIKPKPWEHVVVERIDFWNPKDMPQGVIDPEIIKAHLDLIMPMFPNLITLHVDTRGMPWAYATVNELRKTRVGWGKKVHAFNGSRNERSMAWSALEQRFKSRLISLPNNIELIKELLGVRRQKTLDKKHIEIRDRDRQSRHADIAESLAECCRQAHLQMLKPTITLDRVQHHNSAKDLLAMRYQLSAKGLTPSSY